MLFQDFAYLHNMHICCIHLKCSNTICWHRKSAGYEPYISSAGSLGL